MDPGGPRLTWAATGQLPLSNLSRSGYSRDPALLKGLCLACFDNFRRLFERDTEWDSRQRPTRDCNGNAFSASAIARQSPLACMIWRRPSVGSPLWWVARTLLDSTRPAQLPGGHSGRPSRLCKTPDGRKIFAWDPLSSCCFLPSCLTLAHCQT